MLNGIAEHEGRKTELRSRFFNEIAYFSTVYF